MKSKTILPVLCAVLGLLVPTLGQAENLLVNWGGDYLDMEASGFKLELGPASVISDETGKAIGVGFAYDESTPKSPAGPRYNLQKPSAAFYGVLQVLNPGTPEDGDAARLLRSFSQVKAMARKNAVGFGSAPVEEGQTTSLTGLVFWQKQDFLRGGKGTEKISWSRIVSLTVNIVSLNTREGGGNIRFALRSGGKWFLSESEQQKTGPFALHSSNWAEWKGLGSSFPLPEIPTDFGVRSEQLTDITAVGIFFQSSSSKPGSNAVFAFNSFQVEGNP